MEAEKNKISDTHITAITNFVWKVSSIDMIAGTYISAKVIVDAFATRKGESKPKIEVIG